MKRSQDNSSEKFKAHLHRGGLGLAEMHRLLEAFAEHGDFERLKEQASDENLLGKTSQHTIKALLSAFRRRFLGGQSLPPAPLAANAVRAPMAGAAKTQILFPYFVCTDFLVDRCYRDLVLPVLASSDPELSVSQVEEHLRELSVSHPELAEWSDYLRIRWSRAFLSLLRRFGLMERHPGNRLERLWLLPESFAFFWIWIWGTRGSFRDAESSSLWEILQLDQESREELLTAGKVRAWWHYERLGEIVQFQPRFETVQGWLLNGLA